MADNAALKLMKKANTKSFPFKDGEVEIRTLTLNQVNAFAQSAKEMDDLDDLEKNRDALARVLRSGVVGLEDVTDEDLDESPLSSLKELSDLVLEFNGLSAVEDTSGGSGNG